METQQTKENTNNSMDGGQALQLAKELSKLPELTFTIAFYPYSKSRGKASNKLKVKEGCRARTQLPEDQFEIDSENFFLFTDAHGKHQTCYKYLIRYMAFPQDNFKMHKINWYE